MPSLELNDDTRGIVWEHYILFAVAGRLWRSLEDVNDQVLVAEDLGMLTVHQLLQRLRELHEERMRAAAINNPEAAAKLQSFVQKWSEDPFMSGWLTAGA